ncbi:hypothetical protein MUCCIDRAFT_85955 [Mucor lusitanicus CBS 277.49]|uniref:Tc1-like transposase DDE domain-containing protein n=1 Tax=Mucor lusitanicus CBS 277.49 TaxID=747725 RepID=A0A162QBK2_MUCCL|nr:hypothetical protein MUCCIDRAFT_85955 [Mucor lusitanicus CBS 277.49]
MTGIYISTVYVYAELYCKHNYTPKRRKRGPETKIDLTPYIPYMMDKFSDVKPSKPTFYRFIKNDCCLSIKKIEKHTQYRHTERVYKARQDVVAAWLLLDTNMDFQKNCVFLDDAGFNLQMTRTRGWSKKGTACILEVAKNAEYNFTVLGAIYHGGLIDLYIHKPTRATILLGKRKADDEGNTTVDNKRSQENPGTNADDYLKFITRVLDALDEKGLKNFYLVQDN